MARHTSCAATHEEQHAEQPLEHGVGQRLGKRPSEQHAPHAGEPEDDGSPQPDVPVAPLAPGADGDDGQHREQRRRLRVQLVEAEHERERRDEQDAAADPEQAGQHAGQHADGRSERHLLHQTSIRTATAASTHANATVSVRDASRC